MNALYAGLWAVSALLRDRVGRITDGPRDRGDVPGWVLITLMTAGIVTALWVVAEPMLKGLLTNALNISGDPSQ